MKVVAKATFGIAILASVMFGASAAFGSTAPSTPTGGAVNVYLTFNTSGNGGSILITGAIGDYGKTNNIKGQKGLALVKLHKGTFEVNTSKVNAANNSATPSLNSTTCSFSLTATAPITVLDGTGLYAGISGTLNFTTSFAGTGPLYKSGSHKGQCNTSNNAVPYAQVATGFATGTVSFSS
jgi:hypothetical protein